MPAKKPTYIVGHKNPDADSICAAIAYADYKSVPGASKEYLATRCGNSNARIDAILNRFQLPLPKFLQDVTPRVRDIMHKDLKRASLDHTCAEVLEVMDEFDFRSLPVVDEQESLVGTISIFDLGEFFIPGPTGSKKMRHVRSSFNHIIRSLKAEVLTIREPDQIIDLFVRVGAMDIRAFGNFFQNDDYIAPDNSVIIVGDRWDIQEKSIQLGVRLLVITGGLEVDDDIVERAVEKGVSIIVSPHDTATTAWTIRSATKIDDLMNQKFVQFTPNDRLDTVSRKVRDLKDPLFMVVDDKKKLVGVFSKTDLIKPIETEIILVDHNELTQAVTGAAQVNILEVVDHHRLGNPPTDQPILFINRPVGSSCTIIADMYRQSNRIPSAKIAGIMMSGIISDTLKLKGPTSTPLDEDMLVWLAGIANEDIDALADMIFNSGSVLVNMSSEEAIRVDCKQFEECGWNFSAAQIEELGMGNFQKKSDALYTELEKYRIREGLSMSVLLVTDINTQNSVLLTTGEEEIIEAIEYEVINAFKMYNLPGIVSRKKQLIPYLSTVIKKISTPVHTQ